LVAIPPLDETEAQFNLSLIAGKEIAVVVIV
jgi:hypothetical protein